VCGALCSVWGLSNAWLGYVVLFGCINMDDCGLQPSVELKFAKLSFIKMKAT
jgi:hypothetical protein